MNQWLFQMSLGGMIRIAESFFAAGPTLLVGLLIAAVLRFYLGVSSTKRLFGGDSLRAIPQSWAIGMLMPVCSIGVLPVLFEMRRCRIKPGAMFAFALSAPLFNPLSLLYGLTLSRPYVILMFALGSLIVVTIVGLAWDWYAKRDNEDDSEDVPDTVGIIGVQRLLATGLYICRQLAGPAGGWMIVGTLGMFLLAATVPWGSLQSGLNRDDWWAPARMASVAIPAYATPMMTMSQIGTMFQHANSPGAAFVLLVIGAGVNLATVLWLACHFGIRNTSMWFGCLMLVVVSIAYGVNRPLVPPGVDPIEHSHAFDIYTNPLHHLDTASGSFAIKKLFEGFGIIEQITLTVLSLIAAIGLLSRIIDWQGKALQGENRKQSSDQEESPWRPPESTGWDPHVGPQTIGATLLAGMVVLSGVMCYAYYPSTDECLAELHHIRGDMISGARSGDAEYALFWIPRFDEWTRRLEVGTFLRRGQVTPYQRMQSFLIRNKVETLKHELEHGHNDSKLIWEVVDDLEATYTRWVRAFRNQPIADTFRSGVDSVATGSGDAFSHSESPHGGQVVTLREIADSNRSINLRLEVMPIREDRITVYLLKEQLGVLRTTSAEKSKLTFELQPVAYVENDTPKVSLETNWNSKQSAFEATLPDDHHQSEHFSVTIQCQRDDQAFSTGVFDLFRAP